MKNIKGYMEHMINKKYKSNNLGLHCHCAETKERLLELLEKAKEENVGILVINNYKSLKIYTQILPQLSDEELQRLKKVGHDIGLTFNDEDAYLAHPSSYFAKVGTQADIDKEFNNVVKFVEDFIGLYSPKSNTETHIDGAEVYHPSYVGNMEVTSEIR